MALRLSHGAIPRTIEYLTILTQTPDQMLTTTCYGRAGSPRTAGKARLPILKHPWRGHQYRTSSFLPLLPPLEPLSRRRQFFTQLNQNSSALLGEFHQSQWTWYRSHDRCVARVSSRLMQPDMDRSTTMGVLSMPLTRASSKRRVTCANSVSGPLRSAGLPWSDHG